MRNEENEVQDAKLKLKTKNDRGAHRSAISDLRYAPCDIKRFALCDWQTMKVFETIQAREVKSTLRRGGVGVIPTDTIYGIVGSAFSRETVARIYRLRNRSRKKPMIILIGKMGDLVSFGIKLTREMRGKVNQFWPGKVSIILPCRGKDFEYLHRGTETLAFRLPEKRDLRALLRTTGPLVAPSANTEGKQPASTLTEAETYFGRRVDFYVDGGCVASAPSTLIEFKGDKAVVLRRGGR